MFRRILLAAAIAIALSDAALAAEPLPPPPPIWTGFYAGLNAGYTFGGSNDVNLLTAGIFAFGPFTAEVANAVASRHRRFVRA
jgi:outer membrane immunogenic protein